jgi:hypothetical protein
MIHAFRLQGERSRGEKRGTVCPQRAKANYNELKFTKQREESKVKTAWPSGQSSSVLSETKEKKEGNGKADVRM